MKKIRCIVYIIFLAFISSLYAEQISSPTWGYSLDLPEGFVLANREGNTRYLFQHSILPVDLQIALYKNAEFSDIKKMSEHIFSQLKMTHKDINFEWYTSKAVLSSVKFSSSQSSAKRQDNNMAGWLLILELPHTNDKLVLLGYADIKKAKQCEPLIISVLDTVSFDYNSYLLAGPVTTALCPKTGEKKLKLL